MMSSFKMRSTLWLASLALLASCGSPQSSGQSAQPSYKDTKSMVLDVLKTEEAQKAIQSSQKQQDGATKLLSTSDGQQIQMAVKDVLTDPTNSKIIEKTMTDPKFAGDFAKVIQKNDKQLHKDLMKDPEYQKSLLEVMNHPEFEQTLLRAMKAPQYRQQTMGVIQESMQNPLFRAQLLELMTAALQQNMKSQQAGGGGGGGQGDQQGGKGGGQGGGGQGGGQQGGDKSGGKSQDGGDTSSDSGDDKKKKDES